MKSITESKKISIVEKNSIFIGRGFFVKDKNDVEKVISSLKNEDKDYTHIVYAFRLTSNEFYYTDDREPKNCAGLPVYNVIEKNDLYFSLITVTRFFGGIKLGASGLVRAYSRCAIETLKNSIIKELEKFSLLEISTDYNEYNKILHVIERTKHKILVEDFKERVKAKIYVNAETLSKLEKIYPDSFEILDKDILLPY